MSGGALLRRIERLERATVSNSTIFVSDGEDLESACIRHNRDHGTLISPRSKGLEVIRVERRIITSRADLEDRE